MTMKKTANTLNVGEIIYTASVDTINEYIIEEIRKKPTGISIKYYSGEWTENQAAISVSFKGYCDRTYFFNKEDAEALQSKLRLRELKSLQNRAEKAIKELNEFTLKHFTNE